MLASTIAAAAPAPMLGNIEKWLACTRPPVPKYRCSQTSAACFQQLCHSKLTMVSDCHCHCHYKLATGAPVQMHPFFPLCFNGAHGMSFQHWD